MSPATRPVATLVALPEIIDARGSLGFVQVGDQLPFTPRRAFYLYGIAEGQARGGHAHLDQHQFIIMLAGGCHIDIDNGLQQQTVSLEKPSQGLYVPPMLWLDLTNFSPGAVCLVLTSDVYDEADYIRDPAQFRTQVSR